MTAPARLLVPTLVCLLALAPAASAATTAAWDSADKVVTLTNDADGESFAVFYDDDTYPYTVKVTATNAGIPVPAPAGSNCVQSDAGKSLTCTAADVNRIAILGAAGNDSFTISGSTNYTYYSPTVEMAGDAGNDTFTAGPGSSLGMPNVDGGADDDTFNGSDGVSETFFPEPGNDTYDGGTAPVAPGHDPATYQLLRSEDNFSAGSSVLALRRKRLADPPVNLSLDDVANDADGMGGTDNLLNIEALTGTSGNDVLTAGAYGAALSGNEGDDTLTGGPADDYLYGDPGSDTLRGGGGSDHLYDGDYDRVARLASQDPLPVGNDTLEGGDGDDTLVYGAGADGVSGGGGTDTAFFSRIETQVFAAEPTEEPTTKWLPVSLSLDDQPNDGAAGEGDNLHSDVENIDTTATSYGSVVRRTARVRGTRLDYSGEYSSQAADTIVGSDAANVIETGRGNDSIDGKGGADVVDAGAGDDQVNAIDKVTDIIRCGLGADNVGADLPGTNAARADVLTDCENVTGTPLGLEGGVLPTLPDVPKLTLGGASTIKSKTFLKKYTVRVAVTTDQPATVAGELTTTQARISKVGALSVGSGKLASGTGKRTLKLKVAKKFRKKLKRKLRTRKQRRKGIKLSAVITVKNASGQTAARRRTIKIKG